MNLKKLEFYMDRMPVWIQPSRVPLELFTWKGLSYVVSALGKPLYMMESLHLSNVLLLP
ncbi:hypothetical protein Gogos_018377, partial [Gossypium gossypioides]|nr:hypothetical protein [Gossypium gossypioides]